MTLRTLLVALLLTFGCTPTDPPETDAGPAADDAGPPLPRSLGPDDRPADLVVPPGYDGTPTPVVILLHGYGAAAAVQDPYLGLTRTARQEGFILVLPDGTMDTSGSRFWNATPACCDFGGTQVDDVGYLIGLLDELESLVSVDTDRVFLLGHSNGGFMSYRMACEHSDRITAIASLAGSDFAMDTDCEPAQPVSVLQIHGTADATIAFAGEAQGAYPSAADTVARWAARAGCGAPVAGDSFDFDTAVDGDETSALDYDDGCSVGSTLWTMEGSSHIPSVNAQFSPAIYAWFEAHAR